MGGITACGFVRSRNTARAAVLLVCTAPTMTTAKGLARGLLTRRLAACVSMLPGACSAYWWRGRIEQARETVLLIKTARRRLAAAMRFVKAAHPYTVPELIALPIVAGHPDYLAWLTDSCRG